MIARYAELYAQKASTPHRVLGAIHRRAAEEAGLDIVSLVGMLLAERRREIEASLEDFATTERFEAWVERMVRREIWKLSRRNRRAPVVGDPLIEQAEEKGYQPASNGEPRSTFLFETCNEPLESAIRRVQGKSDDQRRLYEVLARLHVLRNRPGITSRFWFVYDIWPSVRTRSTGRATWTATHRKSNAR